MSKPSFFKEAASQKEPAPKGQVTFALLPDLTTETPWTVLAVSARRRDCFIAGRFLSSYFDGSFNTRLCENIQASVQPSFPYETVFDIADPIERDKMRAYCQGDPYVKNNAMLLAIPLDKGTVVRLAATSEGKAHLHKAIKGIVDMYKVRRVAGDWTAEKFRQTELIGDPRISMQLNPHFSQTFVDDCVQKYADPTVQTGPSCAQP